MTSDGLSGAAATASVCNESRLPAPQLRALVLCDLAPEAIVEDAAGAELIRRHDTLVRELIARHGGHEADRTEGFLALFERPIQAVAFALDYQRGVVRLTGMTQKSLPARVGIHVGDVVTWRNSEQDVARGARQVEVEGLAKPVAARLMHLARPGQILLSSIALALAQRAESELGREHGQVRWLTHGPYRFKGVPAPMVVHEVGEAGVAPLKSPPSDDKAVRAVPWWRRPAALAAETLAIAAVVLALFVLGSRPQPAIAFVERDWVVVGDLTNLTGDEQLTEALDTAFRISLEQSRHVNVLSDLKVRDTLRRMQRPGARVDRETGAEIALREGARALILPTVADVGGRVRVSAEIVDPHGQTTVFAESHDGPGTASALVSVDRVTAGLRASLGEAMRAIEADSRPLPEVTTGELDALRHYADAIAAFGRGRYADARRGFAQAIDLDPAFALAHLGKAQLHMGADHLAESRRHLDRALDLRERLTSHERLKLEVMEASFRSLDDTLERLRVGADLFPDRHWIHSTYALFAWERGNRYEEALQHARQAEVPQNPNLASLHYLLAMLHLGLEDYDEALAEVRKSEDQGRQGLRLHRIGALAARGDFDAAQQALDALELSGNPSNDLFRHIAAASLALDQGRWRDALDAIDDAGREAAAVSSEFQRLFATIDLSLRSLDPADQEIAAAMSAALEAERPLLEDTTGAKVDHAAYRTLYIAWLGYRSGHRELADSAVSMVVDVVRDRAAPMPRQMLAIARAEGLRQAGQSSAAVALLEPLLGDSALLGVHLVLAEAYADVGEIDQALVLSRALAKRRGRAYTEYGSLKVQQPLTVLQTRLALLRSAEFALAGGAADEARTHLLAFLTYLPGYDGVPGVATRVARLREALGPDAGP